MRNKQWDEHAINRHLDIQLVVNNEPNPIFERFMDWEFVPCEEDDVGKEIDKAYVKVSGQWYIVWPRVGILDVLTLIIA